MATTAVQAVEKNITSVALADIQPSSYNPRKNFDETSLAELAESIRQQGVLQPIGVRPIADNRFEIVFGERRYRASLMAELAEIPATVMEISDETAEEWQSPRTCIARMLPRLRKPMPTKTHRQRSPRCPILDRAVRQDGSVYPYTT